MILTCPSCTTRYLIDPAALGEAGRVVRCARCSHSWTERPPEDMPKRVDVIPPPEQVTPLPPGSNLPVIREARGTSSGIGWAALAAVIVVVLAGAYLARDRVIEAWPLAAQLYAQLGLDVQAATRGLELRNVQQSTIIEDERTVVVVTGEIVNVSGRTRDVPKVVAEIMDKEQIIIHSWMMTPADSRLPPGESTAFSDRLTDPPKNAVQLKVRLDASQ